MFGVIKLRLYNSVPDLAALHSSLCLFIMAVALSCICHRHKNFSPLVKCFDYAKYVVNVQNMNN